MKQLSRYLLSYFYEYYNWHTCSLYTVNLPASQNLLASPKIYSELVISLYLTTADLRVASDLQTKMHINK